MLVRRIQGATRVLGQSQGYIGLPVRDCTEYAFIVEGQEEPGVPVMQSAWEPTPDEIMAIMAGASIVLEVLGTTHPPVRLTVGPMPRREKPRET